MKIIIPFAVLVQMLVHFFTKAQGSSFSTAPAVSEVQIVRLSRSSCMIRVLSL